MIENTILPGNNIDTLKTIPDSYVNCCVTSPPYYGLRDYGIDGQIGLEETPEAYIQKLVEVFREVKRVLRDDGTLWVNIGDSYAGSGQGFGGKQIGKYGTEKHNSIIQKVNGCKPKDLIGIPWMLAFALRADGWYLRQEIVWAKPNPMPESVKDRCTKSHEYIFLLSKSPKYYFDNDAIREPLSASREKQSGQKIDPGNRTESRKDVIEHDKKRGSGGHFDGHKWYLNPNGRNKRDVWTVPTKKDKDVDGHFAVFPEALIRPAVLAGCPVNGIVLDPFLGSGTTAVVAIKLLRRYIGCEINPDYIKTAEQRIDNERGLFNV